MSSGIDKDSVIVIGVDGSEPSVEALHWAADLATVTGATLEVVAVWAWPSSSWGRVPTWPLGEHPRDEKRKMLREAVERVLGSDTGFDVRQIVVEGHPAPALIAAAEHADLLVVGSRGHGALVDMWLGSVSRHCASHAACPVVVVHHRKRAEAGRRYG